MIRRALCPLLVAVASVAGALAPTLSPAQAGPAGGPGPSTGPATATAIPPGYPVVASDGITTLSVHPAQGTLAGRQATVIVAPGWNCLPAQYTKVTKLLTERGFTVAVLSHGENSSNSVTDWDRWLGLALDALLAADASPASPLRFTIDHDRIGLVGHSIGAAAAALVASHDHRYKAVALCGPEALDKTFLAAAPLIQAALVTIDGSLDRIAPPDQRSKPIVDVAPAKYKARIVVKDGNHPNCPADFDANYIRDPGRWVMTPILVWPFVAWTYDFPIVPGVKPIPGPEQRKIAYPYLAAWMDRFVAGRKDADGWTDGTKGDAQRASGVLSDAWFNAAARSGH